MKAIFTSKMYLASSRKDRIRAAIANPVNAELVTQLKEYLDDESIEDAPNDEPVDDTANDGVDSPETLPGDAIEDMEFDETPGDDDTSEEFEDSTRSDEDILDALNEDSQTEGARRVETQGSELWVYYGDNINLNTVMESVISRVNEMVPDMSFNRLARTSNAIVFATDE